MVMPKYTPFVLILLLFGACNKSFASSFIPIDNYLVACGSSHDITFQGRTFIPEFKFNHSNLQIIANKSIAVTSKPNTTLSPLYNSAQLFFEKASYKFKIQQHGRHWIRLYFHPFPDSNPNMTFASIKVTTDSFVLLDNFTFANYTNSHFKKEYAINITSDELSLTFIPLNNSLVFVNAIEVISISDELFFDHIVVTLNPSGFFEQFSKSALETVYRVNIGGATLSDTLGRTWENDEYYFRHPINTSTSSYLVSTNPSAIKYSVAAPPSVYATARALKIASQSQSQGYDLSWIFNVDPNFMYFVRVHFCDIINNSLNNKMVFNLFINGAFAVRSLDLSSKTRRLAVPYYHDFISYSSRNTFKVSVSVDPDTRADTLDAIMNGVEILKISNNAGRLNEFSSFEGFYSNLPENEASVLDSPKKTSKISTKLGIWWAVILIGCSVCVLAFLAFGGLSFCYLKGRWRKKKSVTSFKFLRHYTLPEMQQATNYFDAELITGAGGFGKVYKGKLENGKVVAIKVANPESRQGLSEFQNEIELLSGLRHQNLVSLVGCCNEDSELILVYNYMANGSLNSHLYGRDFVPLSWKQRLGICLGAAKGLLYLHTGAKQSIIHRDVKTTNILLDENLVPKVADFGISKKGPLLDKSHVTTNVKGSFGYVDPEYFWTKYLTKKSDVYSFGVVLIEVICGKPALDDARKTQEMNLALWALSCHKKGTFNEMVDPYLIGKVNMDSLNKVLELAWKCLEERRVNRPSMGYVLCQLEEALHLELASHVLNDNDNEFTDDIEAVV
ncbi:receptor-like protein kinase THESEUS 1 [Trifolium pratense]|uniref:receptor-like protein kinase THESEUS 1 n=1 Tax=Trifolium pratense TaxID=57577 RepID=UPI001E6957F9|nr:receptor-like protein kinase THESEUS 1 [Trifolium pratense]